MFPSTARRLSARAFARITRSAFASSSDAVSPPSSTSKSAKPKRDLTNPVVRESIRRKKVAKGIIDARAPVPELCDACGRRFCRCENAVKPPNEAPRKPLESDCCHSDPRCKFCVFVVYDELLDEYERSRA